MLNESKKLSHLKIFWTKGSGVFWTVESTGVSSGSLPYAAHNEVTSNRGICECLLKAVMYELWYIESNQIVNNPPLLVVWQYGLQDVLDKRDMANCVKSLRQV